MKNLLILLAFLFFACGTEQDPQPKPTPKPTPAPTPTPEPEPEPEPTPDSVAILVFTKTAKFRHTASINAGTEWLQQQDQYKIHLTEDGADFNPEFLQQFSVIIFLNTTGDILNETEQQAMQQYISAGGGFVGIHSATDTEYDWPWYGELIGGWFNGHPEPQEAELQILEPEHEIVKDLPNPWIRFDEWYNFRDLHADNQYLISINENSYQGGEMGDFHPMVWCKEFDGGRSAYTALGHTAESWQEPEFQQHILQMIEWAAQ